MLREPFVSSGRAINLVESGFARHGTYHRVVNAEPEYGYGVRGTVGNYVLSAAGTRVVTTAPSLGKTRRLPLVDAARFFCAAFTVWVHSPDNVALVSSLKYGRVSMEFFTLLAVFFMARWALRHKEGSWKDYALERLQRLYLPFLAWTFIYFGLSFIRNIALHHRIVPIDPTFWYNGNMFHLWFMPFLIVATIGLYPFAQWTLSRPRLLGPICALLGILGIAVSFIDPAALPQPRQFSTLWWVLGHWGTIPCLPWGIAAALLHNRYQQKLACKHTLSVGITLLVTGLALRFFTDNFVILEAIGGLGLLIVTLSPITANKTLEFMARCGPYTFGIYLSHIVFIRFFKRLNEGLLHFGTPWWFDLVVFAGSLALSLTAVALMAQSPRTRWMIASDGNGKARPATKADDRKLPALAVAA